MLLYLDSADPQEIAEAMEWGFIDGLTTTPTFMHRQGVTDIDQAIVQLSQQVPEIQIEALGSTPEEICAEAFRQLDLGLDPEHTVFKIPVSPQGLKACHILSLQDIRVNVHLVYTLQQAYLAMQAGASFVCPLIGRLQDQGHDALGLLGQIVEVKEKYGYSSHIMFSSVRHSEHIRNALQIGVDACTIPWRVLRKLTDNHFTSVGLKEFENHTRWLSRSVGESMRTIETTVSPDIPIRDALVTMSTAGYGAVTVVDDTGIPMRVFTDGDLRRLISSDGPDILMRAIGSLGARPPISIDHDRILDEARRLMEENKVDTLVVTADGQAIGMIDIQDLF